MLELFRKKMDAKKNILKIGGLNILLLGLVSLINDFSSEMITPLLPMFITALGGGGLIIGLIGGLRASLASILKVFSGFWSDKVRRRKPFIFTGYFTSESFKLLLALSKTWPHVLIFSGIERMGKGIREAPRDALISESMPKRKGRGFGIHRAFDTTGAILGSIAVLILFWFLIQRFEELTIFKTIIVIAALIGFLSLIPLYFVKEMKVRKKQMKRGLGSNLKKLPKPLKVFILIAGVFALANFSYMFFILKAGELFPQDVRLAVAAPLLLYVFFNIFYAAFAVPFGNLSDRIGRKKVLIAGYSLFSLTCLGFALFSSFIAYICLFIFYGLSYAIIIGNQRAFISDLSGEEIRGTALGAFQTTIGLIALPASIIAGILWQINTSITFVYGAVMGMASVILFLSFGQYFRK